MLCFGRASRRRRNAVALALALLVPLGVFVLFQSVTPATSPTAASLPLPTAHTPMAQLSSSCEVVHVAMVVVGVNATRAAVSVLRSLLWRRTVPLALHILTDDATRTQLERILVSWQIESAPTRYYDVEHYTTRVAWVPTAHASGVFGLAKLVYAQALANVRRVVALDVDLVLQQDVALLWSHFARFSATQLFAAAEQQSGWYLHELEDSRGSDLVWPARGRGINSGVMLLHLERMRTAGWDALWPPLARTQLTVSRRAGLADQDIFNLVHVHHPERVYLLPCEWNVQLHAHTTATGCLAHAGAAVLHWNSPQKLDAHHPHAARFRRHFWAIQALDGAALRLLPWPCAAPIVQDALNENDGEDAAEGAHGESDNRTGLPAGCRAANSGAPLRVHPNYYVLQLHSGLYSCGATGLLADRVPTGHIFVKARSAALAQKRYLRHLQELHVLHDGAKHTNEDDTETAGNVSCKPAQGQSDSANGDKGMASDPDVTLLIHLDISRLHVIPDLLAGWDGPVSLALLLGDGDLERLHTLTESGSLFDNARHEVQVHLAFADSSRPAYPVNTLRNLAWDGASTSHVFMLDADFLPGPALYRQLRAATLAPPAAARQGDGHYALVVPAFETTDYHLSLPKESGAAALRPLQASGRLTVFRQAEWPAGHAATNYDKWWLASEAYIVPWAEGYEPYVVLQKNAPRYDERLGGFGWNKVLHLEHLDLQGYSFVVLPDAYIVHRPHAPSLDLVAFRQWRQRPAAAECVKALVKVVREEQQRKVHRDNGSIALPVVDRQPPSPVPVVADFDAVERANAAALRRAARLQAIDAGK